MKAVLLAAGKGKRLKPLTDNIPKVMVPINGKPILEYHIVQLKKVEIKDIFINLHHLSEKIKNYFKDGRKWGVNILYSYEPEILGTAGAVKKLEKELGSDPFLVVYGDNLIEINYRKFIKYSENRDAIGTVAVFEKEDVRGSGILDIGYRNRVLHFVEKPKSEEIFSHWASAGIFYFCQEIFDYIQPEFSDLGFDVLPRVIKEGKKLYAYKLKDEVWGIDNPGILKELIERKSVDAKSELNKLGLEKTLES